MDTPRLSPIVSFLWVACIATGVRSPIAAEETVLVEIDSPMRYEVAQVAGLGESWKETLFDDSGWTEGTYGVGYDSGAMIRTEIAAPSPSVYTRARFTISTLGDVESVWLTADYDDGYVAWVNGVEVVRENVPGGDLEFDTAASGNHESSNGSSPDYGNPIDVSALALPALVEGENVLAIGAWNVDPDSSDLALVPRLSINRPVPEPGVVHWTLADSPVRLSSSLTIPDGTILQIDAGVQVLASSGVSIVIHGQIQAEGTEDSWIVFDRSGTSGTWNGIDIDHGGGGAIRPCSIRFARILHPSTAVDVEATGNSPILIEDCQIDSWSSLAIHWDNGANGLRVSRCRMGMETAESDRGHEAINGYRSSAIVEYCVFGPRRGYNDTVDLGNTRWGGPVPTIRHCEFYGGEDDAIDFDASDGYIVGNFIHGRRPPPGGPKEGDCPQYPTSGGGANGGGITGNEGSRPVILNNIIFDCFQGIGYKNGAQPTIINNTIVGCDWGVVLFSTDDISNPALARGVLVNNLFWDCEIPIKLNWCDGTPLSTAEVTYSCLPGGWPGEGNVDGTDSPFATEPDVANPQRSQFELKHCSAAIDAGSSDDVVQAFITQPIAMTDGNELDRVDMLSVENVVSLVDIGAVEYQGPDDCGEIAPGVFRRGDANGDANLDVSDAVTILLVLFGTGVTDCVDALDADDDGLVNITDAIVVLNFLFSGRAPLPPPFPGAGRDPTDDALGCDRL